MNSYTQHSYPLPSHNVFDTMQAYSQQNGGDQLLPGESTGQVNSHDDWGSAVVTPPNKHLVPATVNTDHHARPPNQHLAPPTIATDCHSRPPNQHLVATTVTTDHWPRPPNQHLFPATVITNHQPRTKEKQPFQQDRLSADPAVPPEVLLAQVIQQHSKSGTKTPHKKNATGGIYPGKGTIDVQSGNLDPGQDGASVPEAAHWPEWASPSEADHYFRANQLSRKHQLQACYSFSEPNSVQSWNEPIYENLPSRLNRCQEPITSSYSKEIFPDAMPWEQPHVTGLYNHPVIQHQDKTGSRQKRTNRETEAMAELVSEKLQFYEQPDRSSLISNPYFQEQNVYYLDHPTAPPSESLSDHDHYGHTATRSGADPTTQSGVCLVNASTCYADCATFRGSL